MYPENYETENSGSVWFYWSTKLYTKQLGITHMFINFT
jgi:hypothetical protein